MKRVLKFVTLGALGVLGVMTAGAAVAAAGSGVAYTNQPHHRPGERPVE
jgi:hypothetical protein